MVEKSYHVTERQIGLATEWDARDPTGKMIGYGFQTKRRAENFVKRYLERRQVAGA